MRPLPYHLLGQSTMEFIIVLSLAVPVLWGIRLMAGVSELGYRARQASQYLVWESTRSPTAASTSLRAASLLFFPEAGDTDDASRHGPLSLNGIALIRARDLGIETRGHALRELSPATDRTAAFLPALQLPARGLHQASLLAPLHRDIGHIPSLQDTLPLAVHTHASLLPDSWMSDSVSRTTARLNDWRLTLPDPQIALLTRTVAQLFHLADLEADPDSFHHRNADTEAVPCALLKGRKPAC